MLPQTVADYQQRLAAGDRQAAAAMTDFYQATLDKLQPDLQHILSKIADAQAAGTPVSPSWLYEQHRLENLMSSIQRDVGAFSKFAQGQVASLQREAILGGVNDAQLALQATVPGGVSWSFNAVPPSAVEAQVGALQPGSPLAKIFEEFGPQAALAGKAALVTAVTTGMSPMETARLLRDSMQMPLQRARTIARTEQMRAYRTAQLQNFQANSDVVNSWIWLAELGPFCCAVCCEMNGSEHSLDETLDSHPNCRCAQVPRTKDWSDILDDAGVPTDGLDLTDTRPQIENGADWFAKQSDATQLAILGPSKFALYQNGDLALKDLVNHGHDPEWGGYRSEKSLADLGFSREDVAAAKSANPISPATQRAADQQLVDAAQSSVEPAAPVAESLTPPAVPEPPVAEVNPAVAEAQARVDALRQQLDDLNKLTPRKATAADKRIEQQYHSALEDVAATEAEIARYQSYIDQLNNQINSRVSTSFDIFSNPDIEKRLLSVQEDLLHSEQQALVEYQADLAKIQERYFALNIESSINAQRALLNEQYAAAQEALSRAKGEIPVKYGKDAQKMLTKIFGRELTNQEIISMVGIPGGGQGEIHIVAEGLNSVTVDFNSPTASASFSLSRIRGQIYHTDSYIRNLGERTTTSGVQVLDGFKALMDAGVTKMTATAARGRYYNGYITWAKLGFTGPIPESVIGAARAQFGPGIKNVEQIMQLPGGPAWWQANGDSWDATFDFTPGSYSRSVFDPLYAKIQARRNRS
jgi:uncharacterized coiled-coil protein SlyX